MHNIKECLQHTERTYSCYISDIDKSMMPFICDRLWSYYIYTDCTLQRSEKVYNIVYTISIRAGVEGEKYCKRKETDWGREWFIQGEKGVVYV